MKIKQEYKHRVVTISGTFVNKTTTLGEMSQVELKNLQRIGYPNFDNLIEEPKAKKTKEKKYTGIDETKEENNGEA